MAISYFSHNHFLKKMEQIILNITQKYTAIAQNDSHAWIRIFYILS